MSDLLSAVVVGVAIYVVGQVLVRLVVDPLSEWRLLKGQVAHALIYYRNVAIGSGLQTPEYGEQARNYTRDLAAQIVQRSYAFPRPLRWFLVIIRVVPTWKQVGEARSGMIGFSNSFGTGSDTRSTQVLRVRQALNLTHIE